MIHPGDLLIAPPKMADPRFFNTVILITEVGLNGTKGLCVNKDSGITVNKLLEDTGRYVEPDQKLFWGGPVGNSTLWLLHDKGWRCGNTKVITDQWSMSSSNNMFTDIKDTGGPESGRFILGHSSWAPGQLEMEIEGEQPWDRNSSWLLARCPDPQEVFSLAPSDVWYWACDISAQQTVKDWI